MRHLIIYSLIIAIALTGCGKDKYESKPHLSFTSVNTTELRAGQVLQFTLTFTDKEGDISNSLFFQKIVEDCENSSFTENYVVPSFPATTNQKGEIVLTLGYKAGTELPDISPQCSRDEIAVFRFALSDKKNNVSDTVSSPPIKIIY